MKTIEWLKQYGFIIVIGLLLLNFLQLCSTRGLVKDNIKNVSEIKKNIDSINLNLDNSYVITKEEMQLMLQIQNLKTTKQVLYDWNSVVRTAVRPDDRMNYYDTEIQKFEAKLNDIRTNKILIKK